VISTTAGSRRLDHVAHHGRHPVDRHEVLRVVDADAQALHERLAADDAPGHVRGELVDEPEDEAGEEDEQGDNDKHAGKKGATGKSFVGTRMLQMKQDAAAAAKKALEGQKVTQLQLLSSSQLCALEPALSCNAFPCDGFRLWALGL